MELVGLKRRRQRLLAAGAKAATAAPPAKATVEAEEEEKGDAGEDQAGEPPLRKKPSAKAKAAAHAQLCAAQRCGGSETRVQTTEGTAKGVAAAAKCDKNALAFEQADARRGSGAGGRPASGWLGKGAGLGG